MNDEPVGTFAKRLCALMKRYGMRQADVARGIESTSELVRKWRMGISEPSYRMLKRLHTAVGCTWEELMGE